MAAFTARDPSDRAGFQAFWDRILSEPKIVIRTILFQGEVPAASYAINTGGNGSMSDMARETILGAGHCHRHPLAIMTLLPGRAFYARVAKDNVGSIRVLEKWGFTVQGQEVGFANARADEIEELVLKRERTR